MCVDFTLNNACPKDSYPLPKINKLVDSMAGHELMSFMGAFSGYHQMPLVEEDQKKASFITDTGLYRYNVMLFRLKNVGATYQWLVNNVFTTLIGKTMELYMDDMITKSIKKATHARDLEETFKILWNYTMKLNLKKCTFRV